MVGLTIINNLSVIFALFMQFLKVFAYMAKRRVSKEKIQKPWMKYKEIDVIKEILKKIKPLKCLEWGSGYSSIYFPNYIHKAARWISIENDIDWANHIKTINQRSNVEIFYKKPNNFPWTDENNDGAYSDLKDYIEYPGKFGTFDFILIDGRARKECLLKAYDIINEEGIVILHDAGRIHYHEPFSLYKFTTLFEDSPKSIGGLWVGSKNINIEKVLNIKKHKKIWNSYTRLKNFFNIIFMKKRI